MRVELEFYVSPRGAASDLGRFMDDLVTALSQANASEREKLLHLSLVYLRELSDKEPDELRDYLATRRVWRRLGNLPLYKTADAPCVFFTAVEDAEVDEIRIYALGAAQGLENPDGEGAWERRIAARCRSLGLGDGKD